MRVVAFDDDDQPLVVDDETHRLERAGRFSNYEGISDTIGAAPPYTAVMPGGGWRVEFTNKDGSVYDVPLVGWATKGRCHRSLTVDSEGIVDDLDHYGADPYLGDFRIYHPDARETRAADHVTDPVIEKCLSLANLSCLCSFRGAWKPAVRQPKNAPSWPGQSLRR
jgi:hypothetical protein